MLTPELPAPETSVVIPTFDRVDSLRQTLEALARQDIDAGRFEVIVVDDGSTDDTPRISHADWPFELRYLRQPNQGDAIARNTGAQASRGEVLVFLDDDIVPAPGFLRAMHRAATGGAKRVIVGMLQPDVDRPLSPPPGWQAAPDDGTLRSIPYTACLSGFMALRRADFEAIGPMRPLETGGSSVWCDVDFAYRAMRAGYAFWRCSDALGLHHDRTQSDLRRQCQRLERASDLAVALFHRHPHLIDALPMFDDKRAIDWRRDPVTAVARKLARRALSSGPSLWVLEGFERGLTGGRARERVRAWIRGAYILRGFRAGERRHGRLPAARLHGGTP